MVLGDLSVRAHDRDLLRLIGGHVASAPEAALQPVLFGEWLRDEPVTQHEDDSEDDADDRTQGLREEQHQHQRDEEKEQQSDRPQFQRSCVPFRIRRRGDSRPPRLDAPAASFSRHGALRPSPRSENVPDGL
ncbi:MAG: hypothetical protein R3E12_02620 [Candidatus Eisenbacteria bacterium]